MNPLHGLRGRGMERKAVYVRLDEELRSIYNHRQEMQPLTYLRAISHRMPDPVETQ